MPFEAEPYEWNDAEPPPKEVLNHWIEVGNGIDKSQTGRFVVDVDTKIHPGISHFYVLLRALCTES